MLVSLHIENIAVIEAADIDFAQGFCVLTGETGAGKSILIDSINAVLGERTSKELIRSGCSVAKVTAVFDDISPAVCARLAQLDVAADDGLLVSRTLTDSKSVIKINGQTVTAALMREIAPFLINIHGQHDSQALLNPDRHYEYIDLLARNEQLLAEYGVAFTAMQSTRHALKALTRSIDERERQRALLHHQINELEAAGITPGEIEQLKQRREAARHSQALLKALLSASRALGGSEGEQGGAITLCDDASGELSSVAEYSAEASEIFDGLSEARDRMQELRERIERLTASFEFDENEVDEISGRLDMYFRFRSKYGEDEPSMLKFLDNAREQLAAIDGDDEQLTALQSKLVGQVAEVKRLGAALTAARRDAGVRFAADVAAQLAFLDMKEVKIEVSITESPYSRLGADRVEFLISTNPGESLKPLYKIASGGEMSRIMLAIKNVLAKNDTVDTLIFDEIDAGISGRAAQKVAQKLKETASQRQVICVTHLAQIAARADNHLLIEKWLDNGRACTVITPLDFDGRRHELARIIGSDATEANLKSAEEMLRLYS